MKIRFNIGKFVIKPALATLIMGICSYFVYNILTGILPGRLATIIAIVFAVFIYLLAVLALKIFNKKEILALPMGSKICRFLEKTKIY